MHNTCLETDERELWQQKCSILYCSSEKQLYFLEMKVNQKISFVS